MSDLERGDVEHIVALAVGGEEGGVHEKHVEDVVITLDHAELEGSVAIGVRNVHISTDLDHKQIFTHFAFFTMIFY